MRSGNQIYHEKQVKSLCALHALNNLFQDGKAFTQNDLDTICSDLSPKSWVNPHKSVLGLGNYDINVIMTALQGKNYETVWFDKRKDPSDLNFSQIFGFILNVPTDCRFGWLSLPMTRKHWVAIRHLSVQHRYANISTYNYYNLDSKFDAPEIIGSEEKLMEYFREELKSPEKELFLVVTLDVGQLQTWKKCVSLENSGAATAGTAPTTETRSSSISEFAQCTNDLRKTSTDSGVVELLSDFKDFKDISVVDLDKEDYFRRQSSGVWSDFN